VLWPFLWIWAMAYKPERGWGFSSPDAAAPLEESEREELAKLRERVAEIEKMLEIGST